MKVTDRMPTTDNPQMCKVINKIVFTIVIAFVMFIFVSIQQRLSLNISSRLNLLENNGHLDYSSDDARKLINNNSDTTIHESSWNVLMFTIVNHGFISFAKNWILNLLKLDMHDFMIICTDKQCYYDLAKWNDSLQDQILLLKLESSLSSNFVSYGQNDYKLYTKQRPIIVKNIYNKLYHQNESNYDAILYLDSDIIALKNFIPIIEKYRTFDITLQIDASNDLCQGTGNEIKYCSCFILIPLNKDHHFRVNFVLNEWENECDKDIANKNKLESDQEALKLVLYRNNNKTIHDPLKANIGTLNCNHFPSGWMMQHIDNFWIDHHHEMNIVHSNWMEGYKNKKIFFKKYGLWLLDTAIDYS